MTVIFHRGQLPRREIMMVGFSPAVLRVWCQRPPVPPIQKAHTSKTPLPKVSSK